jgi:VanZ family protein
VNNFVKWWLPVVIWMVAIFIGSSIGSLPRLGDIVADGLIHHAAHMLEFAILSALLLRALSKERAITSRNMIVTLIIAAVYGASDEFHQRFTPGRSSEGLSVLFDVAGGLIGMWVYRWRRIKHTADRQHTDEPTHQRAGSAMSDQGS